MTERYFVWDGPFLKGVLIYERRPKESVDGEYEDCLRIEQPKMRLPVAPR